MVATEVYCLSLNPPTAEEKNVTQVLIIYYNKRSGSKKKKKKNLKSEIDWSLIQGFSTDTGFNYPPQQKTVYNSSPR